MALTESQLADYHQQGYIVVRGIVPPSVVADLQREVDGLHERMAAKTPVGVGVSWEDLGETGPRRIRQLMNSERVCPTIDAITRGDAVLDIMEQLVGPDILLFHSKLMMKSAKDGTFTPWHQDWGYWRHGSDQPTQVNCMLAIDAATEANGCIRFVPGSHHDGPIDHQDFKTKSFSIGLANEFDAYESVPVEMAPGDAVFFGPLVIHGSAPNTSAQHRRANTFAFDRVGNQTPDLPPDRLRRGSYPEAARTGVYAQTI